ncbi:hypothetical protein Aperf_G00000098643 [Anoplocephala perfoliata]
MDAINSIEVFFVATVLTFALSPVCSTNPSGSIEVCDVQLDQSSTKINQDLLKSLSEGCTNISISSVDTLGRIIDPDAFHKFTQLISLSIRTNLSSMDSFVWLQGLEKLEYLNLSHCNIEFLNTAELNSGFPSLRIVDLSHNVMEYLYLPFLFDAPQLQQLDISSNMFRNFPDISSSILIVNIVNNPLQCTCTNVDLQNRGNFLTSNFTCDLNPCTYFLDFISASPIQNLSLLVAEHFNISCRVNASNDVKFGIFSPIGFIPGPSWGTISNKSNLSHYQYTVFPVHQPVRITVLRSGTTLLITTDYARGHHDGSWQCAALSTGGLLLDKQINIVTVRTGIGELFLSTIILGFIIMGITLIISLIIGGVRYLVETDCFRRPQTHKYVVRPMIGVIPVPVMHPSSPIFTEEIPLDQRICPSCINKPFFFCGYCNDHHVFSNFEVRRSEDAIPSVSPPPYGRTKHVIVDVHPLPTTERRGDNEDEDRGDEIQAETVNNPIRHNSHENVLNYDFPSEFCHCHHVDVRFADDGEPQASAAVRDVKLICRDEQLAQEYTEVLERLQAAAKSNDPATFKERLEEFRGRLVHDVGRRVRVAREEIVAFTERSARSVARIRDQGGAVAQFMKAGLSQVRDGMRSVAELCAGGSDDNTACESSDATDGVETIGQSISVVSIYKDETTKKPQERFVSNFTF